MKDWIDAGSVKHRYLYFEEGVLVGGVEITLRCPFGLPRFSLRGFRNLNPPLPIIPSTDHEHPLPLTNLVDSPGIRLFLEKRLRVPLPWHSDRSAP